MFTVGKKTAFSRPVTVRDFNEDGQPIESVFTMRFRRLRAKEAKHILVEKSEALGDNPSDEQVLRLTAEQIVALTESWEGLLNADGSPVPHEVDAVLAILDEPEGADLITGFWRAWADFHTEDRAKNLPTPVSTGQAPTPADAAAA